MLKAITPASLRAPFARYSHGIEVPAGARLVFCSGQLGISADDAVRPAGRLFAGAAAILAPAAMGLGDIVRRKACLTAREPTAGYLKVGDRLVGTPPPASTLMTVSGFKAEGGVPTKRSRTFM